MNVKKIPQLILTFTCFFGLFSFGSHAFAATLYNQPFSTIEIQNTSSWCFVAFTKPPCLTSFTLSSDTTFVYGESRIVVYGLRKTGSPNTPALNISNAATSQYVNFSNGEINNTSGEKTFISYSGSGGGSSTTLTAGTYYVWLNQDDNSYWWFGNGSNDFAGYISTDDIPPPPLTPEIYTFTYSTSTATANITGYWEATTTPYITQRLTFWQYSDTLGEESREQLIATTTGLFNFTFTFNDPYSWSSGESSTTPIFSTFTLNASLDQYDETNYNFPFGGTIIDNLDATSTTISASVYNASDFINTPRDLALYPEYECGITSIIGCIKNALIWTFYPTQNALDSWTSLKTTLETKAPFGYFYSVKNAVGGLSATSTPSFSLTIPAHLKTYFFDPFDTGIAGILWFFFIFHFYKRLKHIQI